MNEQIQIIVESLIHNSVYCCQTSLIEELLEHPMQGFSVENEDIENYFAPIPENLNELEAFAIEYGYFSRQELLAQREAWGDNLDAYEEELREQIRDTQDPQEVFEWWAVSNSLAEKLCTCGFPVIRNNVGYWWGRTESGQALTADYALNCVAKYIYAETH